VPILVLPPRMTEDSQALQQAAVAQGWGVECLANWRPPAWLRTEQLVLYGEPLFADVVAGPLGLALLECPPDWLTQLPSPYLQRTVSFGTLAEVRGCTAPTFIKPALDKCFPAGVYASGEALPATVAVLPETTPVLYAEPVHWEIEFRCFVLERTVAALSPYLREGELVQAEDGSWPASALETTEAEHYIHSVLLDDAVPLPPAVVVDIGRIAGRGWAIIEANAAWGSGLYGCDPGQVLAVLRRASLKENAVTANERAWLRLIPEVSG
jgi:ATP-grasp domain, R2K clade family 2